MSDLRRVLRITARATGWLARFGLLLAAVYLSESVVVDLVVSVVLALAIVIGLLRLWAVYVEPRVFGPPTPSAPDELVVIVDRRAAAELDHVTFARALSAVADAYLDECERRAGLVDEGEFR